MSNDDFKNLEHESAIEINNQKINVSTKIKDQFKEVNYVLTSKTPMDPMTVALTLYLMCKDVCDKLNLEIEDLVDGLRDDKESLMN